MQSKEVRENTCKLVHQKSRAAPLKGLDQVILIIEMAM
jgi:hypothetical protein